MGFNTPAVQFPAVELVECLVVEQLEDVRKKLLYVPAVLFRH